MSKERRVGLRSTMTSSLREDIAFLLHCAHKHENPDASRGFRQTRASIQLYRRIAREEQEQGSVRLT
jgi:hypothetical protein